VTPATLEPVGVPGTGRRWPGAVARLDRRGLGAAAAIGLCLAFLAWTNAVTPLWADDYCWVILGGVAEAIARAWDKYQNWTGRFSVIAITHVVMGSGWRWSMLGFDLANALVFLVLIRTVLALARQAGGVAGPRDALAGFLETLFVALLLWWLPRTIGEVALWKTGSIGYLWAVTGELLLLRLVLAGRGGWVLPPFAFVIATFLEPLSLLVTGMLAVIAWQRRRVLPVAVLLAHGAGLLFLLGAPGNFARAAAAAPSPVLDRLEGFVGNLGSLVDPYWLPALTVVLLAYPLRREGLAERLRAGHGWMFAAAAAVYMASLLALPRSMLAARVSFPASVLLVCYLATLFLRRPATRRRDLGLAALVVLLAGLHLAVVVPDLRRMARIARDRDQQMAGQTGDAVVTLVRVDNRLVLIRKHRFFVGITPDPGNFVNRCYARAMGAQTVVAR
jgi:hypothetical protein